MAPCVIRTEGKLDYATVRPLASRLAEELSHGRANLVLDLGEVESLTAGALGALLLQQTDAERRGGTIKLASATSVVYQTLKQNGFTAVFETYDTPDEALRSFASGVRAA